MDGKSSSSSSLSIFNSTTWKNIVTVNQLPKDEKYIINLYTGMSIVLQALRKHQIVIFKSEFWIIRDDDFVRIEIDG